MARHTEYQSCAALVEWWGYAHRSFGLPENLLFHCPNQGASGGAGRGFHLKMMGVRKGMPDYLLLVPSGQYHGMAIEMKSAIGRVSPEQKVMLDDLEKFGYFCVIARDSGTAREAIEQYLKPTQ